MRDLCWPPLIGLAGPARSGKDTAANYLLAAYGLDVYAFAAPLKRGLAAMFGLEAKDLDGERKEAVVPHIGRSPRYLMQTLGTEWGRELLQEDIWLAQLGHELDMAQASCDGRLVRWSGAVISDVRFENEAQWVRGRGGVIVHLSRQAAPAVRLHRSELRLTVRPGDFEVANDAGIDDLGLALDGVMRNIEARCGRG